MNLDTTLVKSKTVRLYCTTCGIDVFFHGAENKAALLQMVFEFGWSLVAGNFYCNECWPHTKENT